MTINFNAFFSRDRNVEAEYLGRESNWAIYYSTCSPCVWDQIGHETCFILKVSKFYAQNDIYENEK